jgi:hypothetical protein
MESSFEDLNARIARLAIGLGISLDTDHEVSRALGFHLAPAEAQERRAPTDRREGNRANTDRRGPEHSSAGPELRIARKKEELRGLLVLRYSMETRYVAEVGVGATRQILLEAETHLMRDGFKPGADGVDLNHLLKDY